MEVGCQVRTQYGCGTVVEVDVNDRNGTVCIELDNWHLANGKCPKLYTTLTPSVISSTILSSSFCDIGTCVYTKYGPGILFKYHHEDDKHVVRLWRPRYPGAATAYMPKQDILRVIKGVPGVSVETLYGTGVVVMYHNETDMYTVQLAYGTAHLNSGSIVSSTEAKVLPASEYLADLTLDNNNIKHIYSFLTENNTVKSMVEPFSAMIEKLKGGQISSVDEVLSLRSKQLNEQVMQLDVNSLNKTLQAKIDSLTDDSSKIEMLLEEGKRRIAAMIENTESRREILDTTKTSLHEYLDTGKEQIDSVLERLKSSSSTEEQEVLQELQSLSADMKSSLSVIRNLASSDPVIEELLKKLDDTNRGIRDKAYRVGGALYDVEAVQVLESGGKNLSKRLANILDNCSGDVKEVKGIGENFLQALESKGAKEKGYALLDGVKSRLMTSIQNAGDETSDKFLSTQSLANTIETHLVGILSQWKTYSSENEAMLQAQLTRLTSLLSLVSEGQVTLYRAGASSLDTAYSSLSSHDLKRTGNIIAREQLTKTLQRVKNGLDSWSGKTSGIQFFRQFNLRGAGGDHHGGHSTLFTTTIFQDTWREVAKISSKKLKGIVEAVDSPLLKDVALPIENVIDQMNSGHFDIEKAIEVAKLSLNSEMLSTSAKEIVATGDHVVSVLEQFREHDAVRGVIDHLKDIDMDDKAGFLSTFNAENALTEVEQSLATLTGVGKSGGSDATTSLDARNKLINSTKDKILGFLLEHIPNMVIPDIQGVKDDVQFAVTKLDMSGFQLKKEDVQVRIGSSLQEEFLVCEASNISAAFKGVKWKYQQLYFPYLSGTGVADATVLNASLRIGLKIIRLPKGTVQIMRSATERTGTYAHTSEKSVRESLGTPTLLDANSSAIYDRFPSIKEEVEILRLGLGKVSKSSSSVSLTDASTSSGQSDKSFWGEEELAWEPVLIMTSQSIDIEHLSLKVDDSSLSWLYNLLASVFEGIIRDYVSKSLQEMLTNRCSTLLELVNSTAVNYWPVIQNILKVDLLKLREGGAKDLAMLLGPPKQPTGESTELEITPREYTLKFTDDGPLGMKLDIFKTGKSGEEEESTEKFPEKKKMKSGSRVLVTGAVKGSQAEKLFDESGIRSFLDGATIVSVNGKSFKYLDENAVLQSLKGSRPLYVTIKLSMASWERLGVHRSILAKEKTNVGTVDLRNGTLRAAPSSSAPANMRKLRVVKVSFGPGPLGLKLKETRSCGGAVIITGFSKTAEGGALQAELMGSLKIGMVMLSINGEVVFGRPFESVMQVIKASSRPMDMMFVPSPDHAFTFDTPPTDLVLGRIEGYVMVTAFSRPDGPAQEKKGLCPGMVILQVNKEPVPSGASPEEVEELINRPFRMGDGATPKTKLAMRDMDSFMHLIRIRDGEEPVENVEISQSNDM